MEQPEDLAEPAGEAGSGQDLAAAARTLDEVTGQLDAVTARLVELDEAAAHASRPT